VIAVGGKIRLATPPSKVVEVGETKLTVVVEFPSLKAVKELRRSSDYTEAIDALGSNPVRDFRIMEGAG
jgi:Protein of unknown function (DUF1330).